MGSTIEFTTATGATAQGYLAEGPAGAPGVIVIQEWWGVVPQIRTMCDRFASAGFTALAPDLYDGKEVPLDEPDEAAKAMMGLGLQVAAAALSGGVDTLVARTGHDKVGVVGFCMGGALALLLGDQRPDHVAAVVPCYGVHPWSEGHPDYASMRAAVQIHCAGLDDYFTPSAAEELADRLRGLGLTAELFLYDGAHHAFANEDRPEVYDASAATELFDRTVEFFHSHL
jgi:carboxymethylenebutenolidase